MKAIGYIRVSTEDQAREGLSLEAQERVIRSYCQSSGLTLCGILREDGVSASVPLRTRPQGSKLCELVESGLAHVVSYKLDRLFRTVVDGLQTADKWHEQGASIHVVDMGGRLETQDPMPRMMYSVVLVFSEAERRTIIARTTMAVAHRRARGDRMGPVPLEDPVILGRIYELYDAHTSYRGICKALTMEGHRPKRGGVWHPETVRKIIARRVNSQ